MDIRQIQYFVRVAELGSFSRASIVLNIAQPALSRQVRLLEVELRQTLLNRNGRGVTTTDAGKLMLEHGRAILQHVERAREDICRVNGHLAGQVTIGMPPSIARVLVLPLTRAFRTLLPNARLSVSEGLSLSMKDALTYGRVDMALLYNLPPSPDMDLMSLKEERLHLVIPAGHELDAAEPIGLCKLATLPLVMPARPHAIRMLVETVLSNAGRKPHVVLEIDSVTTILDLVADGAGFAIFPAWAVSTSSRKEEYQLRPIASPDLFTRLCIATPARRSATQTQQAALDLLADLCRKTLV